MREGAAVSGLVRRHSDRATCSGQVFNELHGNEWSSLSALRDCVGDVNLNSDNALMEVEMKRQRGGGGTGEARTRALCLSVTPGLRCFVLMGAFEAGASW